jgi:hypothetical protein
MTLIFGPSPEQQAFLPLGKIFEMSLSGMVKDNSTQVKTGITFCFCYSAVFFVTWNIAYEQAQSALQAVAVQLPEGLTAIFAGAAPHVTISFADGCTAKQAGIV